MAQSQATTSFMEADNQAPGDHEGMGGSLRPDELEIKLNQMKEDFEKFSFNASRVVNELRVEGERAMRRAETPIDLSRRVDDMIKFFFDVKQMFSQRIDTRDEGYAGTDSLLSSLLEVNPSEGSLTPTSSEPKSRSGTDSYSSISTRTRTNSSRSETLRKEIDEDQTEVKQQYNIDGTPIKVSKPRKHAPKVAEIDPNEESVEMPLGVQGSSYPANTVFHGYIRFPVDIDTERKTLYIDKVCHKNGVRMIKKDTIQFERKGHYTFHLSAIAHFNKAGTAGATEESTCIVCVTREDSGAYPTDWSICQLDSEAPRGLAQSEDVVLMRANDAVRLEGYCSDGAWTTEPNYVNLFIMETD